MTNIAALPTPGRLGLARIAFHANVGSKFEALIPLGVIAEIHLSDVYGLGLIARTSLTSEEESVIAPLLLEKLRSPFDFLNGDFEWAWNNSQPGCCLIELANRHKGSLRFGTPVSKPTALRRSHNDGEAMEAARRRLLEARDKEFWAFLREHEDDRRFPPNRGLDDFQYAEAA
jgi:hypothetical protein